VSRKVLAPRIERTGPVEDTTDQRCEIHVLTSEADWRNTLWALKSFYWASGRRYALCIHLDGSLDSGSVRKIAGHFPSARIIEREEADAAADSALAAYPRCRRLRDRGAYAQKIIDFPEFMSSDRMLLVDSDVLFFSCPEALLNRVEDAGYRKNCVNRDSGTKYSVGRERGEEAVGGPLIEQFNSGLGVIQPGSLRKEWVEEFLAIDEMWQHPTWRIEQTLFALCSSRFGGGLLPAEYDVRAGRMRGDAPVRHYAGKQRPYFYTEGIPRLLHSGLFWRNGTRKPHGRATAPS
jgi:hypothetical protein